MEADSRLFVAGDIRRLWRLPRSCAPHCQDAPRVGAVHLVLWCGGFGVNVLGGSDCGAGAGKQNLAPPRLTRRVGGALTESA